MYLDYVKIEFLSCINKFKKKKKLCMHTSSYDINSLALIFGSYFPRLETWTEPYGPMGKTSNRSFLQFF